MSNQRRAGSKPITRPSKKRKVEANVFVNNFLSIVVGQAARLRIDVNVHLVAVRNQARFYSQTGPEQATSHDVEDSAETGIRQQTIKHMWLDQVTLAVVHFQAWSTSSHQLFVSR